MESELYKLAERMYALIQKSRSPSVMLHDWFTEAQKLTEEFEAFCGKNHEDEPKDHLLCVSAPLLENTIPTLDDFSLEELEEAAASRRRAMCSPYVESVHGTMEARELAEVRAAAVEIDRIQKEERKIAKAADKWVDDEGLNKLIEATLPDAADRRKVDRAKIAMDKAWREAIENSKDPLAAKDALVTQGLACPCGNPKPHVPGGIYCRDAK